MARNPNPKYKTYAELAAAFKSGELDPAHYYLMLDKGGSENCLCWRDASGHASDEEIDRKNEECGDLFNGDLVRIEGAFTALGIPWRWC